jgi:hypothetical protein
MRWVVRWAGLVWAGLVVVVLMSPFARAQIGYDRPGGDYTSFSIRSGDPATCAGRCDRDPRCRAWAFAYPTISGPNAICWLKNRVTRRVEAPCCAAGVRGSGVVAPRVGRLEYSIDRNGGDYRNFEVAADPRGSACRAACEGDSKCRAWTYVRPGYLGVNSAPRCYLKEQLRRPRRAVCCISGVVR